MKKKTLKIIVLVILANILFWGVYWIWAYFVTIPIGRSGEGALSITGKVYEWENAPPGAESKIYIDYFVPNTKWERNTNWFLRLRYTNEIEKILKVMHENVISDSSMVPLKETAIEMNWKESIEGREKEHYLSDWTSDDAGNFYAWIIAPGKGQYIIKANKPGYLEVVGKVTHYDAYNHAVIIAILARDNN